MTDDDWRVIAIAALLSILLMIAMLAHRPYRVEVVCHLPANADAQLSKGIPVAYECVSK